MNEWKNKEVIIGLAVIIILSFIALFLLIRRETGGHGHIWVENTAAQEEAATNHIKAEDDSVTPPAENPPDDQEEKSEDEMETVFSEEEIPIEIIKFPSSGEEIPKQEKELYSVLGEEKYTPAVLTDRKIEDGQLKELAEYWEDYKLNAVNDLIRLERFQKISKELTDSNKFYYYGSLDPLGRPNGKGLAVYENNTYYYGEWKEGLRHGKGMWLEAAIYTKDNEEENLGVVEHSYNGQWSRDLPNGEGQEHFTYDYDILKKIELQDDKAIANVLGNFKNGYYHGEMYVMTTDREGSTSDWIGKCSEGVWEVLMEGNTTDAVWESYTDDPAEKTVYHFMFPEHNKDWGIFGLKK